MSNFDHRIGPFGMHHSICTICFQTVATESGESKLTTGEEKHQCERLRALRS